MWGLSGPVWTLGGNMYNASCMFLHLISVLGFHGVPLSLSFPAWCLCLGGRAGGWAVGRCTFYSMFCFASPDVKTPTGTIFRYLVFRFGLEFCLILAVAWQGGLYFLIFAAAACLSLLQLFGLGVWVSAVCVVCMAGFPPTGTFCLSFFLGCDEGWV